MNRQKSFLKSTLVYFVGNVLMKFMTFLLLPVYTFYISKYDVGYYDNSSSIITFAAMTIALNIWSAVLRFMFDYTEEKGKRSAIHNGLLMLLLSFALYSCGMLIYSRFSADSHLGYIYLYGLFTVLHYFYGNVARGFDQNVFYVLSGVLASAVTLLSNLFLILVLNLRVESLYLSVCLGYLAQILAIELRFRVVAGFRRSDISREVLVKYLRFCLPLSLSTTITWFLEGYNKFFISGRLGFESNGVYSVAGKFSGLLSLLASCIILAWQELVFRNAERASADEKSTTYSKALSLFIYFMLMGISLLVPLVALVFPYLINSNFRESYLVVPFHLIGTSLSVFQNFFSQIFYADKKTLTAGLSLALSAAANVVLMQIFVPLFGLQGVNYSLMASYLIGILFMWFSVRKQVSIKFAEPKILIVLLAVAGSVAVYYMQRRLVSLLFVALAAGLYLYIEKTTVRQIAALVRRRLGRQ